MAEFYHLGFGWVSLLHTQASFLGKFLLQAGTLAWANIILVEHFSYSYTPHASFSYFLYMSHCFSEESLLVLHSPC